MKVAKLVNGNDRTCGFILAQGPCGLPAAGKIGKEYLCLDHLLYGITMMPCDCMIENHKGLSMTRVTREEFELVARHAAKEAL